MNVLITGGCGYTGSVLTKKLLDLNHNITVIDTQWFGNYLTPNKNLKIIKMDVRKIDSIDLKKIDSIVHLANIANDPSVELNPLLSWEINVLATQRLIDKAVKNNVKQFIFASSGSVYGIKEEEHVTEDLELVPISHYNKTKMVAERITISYKDKIAVHCIRPATVCGYSPRMRLDVTVNMFVKQAFIEKNITVFGGNQIRPNINIKDLTNVYIHFLNNMHLDSGCYNAGFENLSIMEIAKMISKKISSKISISDTKDLRSYRQNSDKLLATGFVKKFNIEEAIDDMYEKFIKNKISDTDQCYTVKWMKKIKL
jgi:nucleoside-diphosphate-sugar epimerase